MEKSYQRWQIYWTNLVESPPFGLPHILAEHIIEAKKGSGAQQSAEINAVYEQHKLPRGYAVGWSCYLKPPKTQADSVRAKLRTNKMIKKIQQNYPLFAEQMIEEELSNNADYYQGKINEDTKSFREQLHTDYETNMVNAKNNVGMIIYAKWWEVIQTSNNPQIDFNVSSPTPD